MKVIFLVLIWTTITKAEDSAICKHGSIKQDIKDCKNFYICIYDNWRKATCPENTYFSTLHKFCVNDNSSCYNPSTTITTKSPTTTTTNSQLVCTNGDLKPDQKNCLKFFICLKEKWFAMSCPIGSYFNSVAGFCIIDSNCTCSVNQKITTVVPNCREGYLRPDPNNCAKFFICLRNKWILEKCKVNMHFSQKYNYCVRNDGTCVDVQTTATPKCQTGSLMADDLNCAKYFICLKGDWKILACPMNMYFDRKFQMCLPDYGKCFK